METSPLISPRIRTQLYDDTQEIPSNKQPHPPTFDDLLGQLNDFGRYQIRLVFFLLVPATFMNAFQFYDLVFMTYNPGKDCQTWNLPKTAIQKSYGNVTDQCQYEGHTIHEVVIHCQNWSFSQQFYDNTLATQWGPCQNPVLLGNIMTIFAVVSTIGDAIMSIIQDIIGRKTAYLICLTLCLTGSGFSLLAPSLAIWLAIRALQMSQAQGTSVSIPFIWALEFSGPQKRTVVNFSFCLAYSCATVILGLVAWACHNWIQLGMVTVIPFLLFYAHVFFLDESPRWLLSVGKVEKAIKVMEKLARTNKRESQLEEIKQQIRIIAMRKVEEEANRSKGHTRDYILDLFRHPNLRLKLLLLTFLWCTCNLLYLCLAFNSPNVGNIFVVYITQAAVSLPASFFALLLPNRIGRIPPIILGMCWSAFFSFLCIPAYLNGWSQWSIIFFSAMVKFGTAVTSVTLFQASGELYPTSLRATAMGINMFAADLIIAIMPHILSTGSSARWIPMLIMGLLSACAAACACCLPEPMDMAMPLDVADAERFSKVGFGQIRTHWKHLMGRRGYREME